MNRLNREPRWILKEGSERKEKEDVQQEDRNRNGNNTLIQMLQGRKVGKKGGSKEGRKEGRKERRKEGRTWKRKRRSFEKRGGETWFLDGPHAVLMSEETNKKQ
jgi:hypothetical protein